MNEIIKNIEAAQLKAEPPKFRVGDTVKGSEERRVGKDGRSRWSPYH